MIKADVKIAEQRQIIEVPVDDKSDAIRVLWNTYGPGIDIKRWIEEEKDEQTDSNEPSDSNESDGTSGDPQGDLLQTD